MRRSRRAYWPTFAPTSNTTEISCCSRICRKTASSTDRPCLRLSLSPTSPSVPLTAAFSRSRGVLSAVVMCEPSIAPAPASRCQTDRCSIALLVLDIEKLWRTERVDERPRQAQAARRYPGHHTTSADLAASAGCPFDISTGSQNEDSETTSHRV